MLFSLCLIMNNDKTSFISVAHLTFNPPLYYYYFFFWLLLPASLLGYDNNLIISNFTRWCTRRLLISLLLLPQGNVLQHNVSAGVIISESSLVLQRVARSSAGRYTCHASNAEGEGSSSPFHLHVARKSRIFILFFFVLRHYVFQLRTLCNVLKTVWFHVSERCLFSFIHLFTYFLDVSKEKKERKTRRMKEMADWRSIRIVLSVCPWQATFTKLGAKLFVVRNIFFISWT